MNERKYLLCVCVDNPLYLMLCTYTINRQVIAFFILDKISYGHVFNIYMGGS